MPIKHHAYDILPEDHITIWRYISRNKLESILKNRALFFTRTDKFPDPFEGSLPKKEEEHRNDYQKRFGNDLSDEVIKVQENNIMGLRLLHQSIKMKFVVNCWRMGYEESMAMWGLYLKNNEGIAIKSDVFSLKECFSNTTQKIGLSKIRYLNYETDVWYDKEIYPHYGYNTLTPLLHKRIEYKHEQELRLYYQIPEAKIDDEYWNSQPFNIGMLISVDPEKLIKEVILAPGANNDAEKKVKELIDKHHYSFPVTKSKLDQSPLF